MSDEERDVLIRALKRQIEYTTAYRDSLRDQLTALRDELRSTESELHDQEVYMAKLVQWQQSLEAESGPQELSLPRAPVPVAERFRGMSVREALHAIAADNGGRLVAKNAIKTLIDANFLTNPKLAQQNVYGRISRGKKQGEWTKIRPGVYKQAFNPYQTTRGAQSVDDTDLGTEDVTVLNGDWHREGSERDHATGV